jgi:hypothetical protein
VGVQDIRQGQEVPTLQYLRTLGLRIWQADSGRWHWEWGERHATEGFESREAAIQDALLRCGEIGTERIQRGR